MRESVVHDTTRGQAAFDELQRLYDRGDIQIGVNVVQYNRSGSVFYRALDNNIPNNTANFGNYIVNYV